MVYIKNLMISKSKLTKERGKSEANLSTQSAQTKEDPWISGEDEHKKRSEGFKTEENEGEKKVDRLGERAIRV